MGLDAVLSHKHLYTGYTTTEKKHASTHTRESRRYTRGSGKRFMTRVRGASLCTRVKTRSRIGQCLWRQCIHFAYSAFLGVVYFHPRFTVPLIGTNTWHRRSPRNERNDDLESRVRKESEQPFFRGVVVSSTMITAMSHSKQGIDYL